MMSNLGRQSPDTPEKRVCQRTRLSSLGRPAGLADVALGLGANRGDPAQAIANAIRLLTGGGLLQARCSPLYQSRPVNCEPGTPPFVNAALTARWGDTPAALLDLCQRVETRLGRPRQHSSREARVIDIDLLLFADRVIEKRTLTVPHPRLRERLFVLAPLHDLAPGWRIPPDQTPVTEIYRHRRAATPCPDRAVQRLHIPGEPNGT